MNVRTENNQQQLARKANQFVNQVFYGSLLREFREAQQPTIFDNGPGGMTFMRQLDMELIKRISGRGDSPIAQAIVRKLSRHLQAPAPAADAAAAQPTTGGRHD